MTIIDVRSVNAKFNGSTNDVNAINAAIGVCSARGGGQVIMPEGFSNVGVGTINAAPNVWLRGVSQNGTVLRVGSSFAGSVLTGSSVSGFRVSDFTIDCNDFAAVNAGLDFFGCDDLSIDRISIIKMGSTWGITNNGSNRFRIADCYIAKTTAVNTQNQGIQITASIPTTNGEIIRNVLVNTAMDIEAINTDISYNKVSGWKFGGGITTEQSADCHNLRIHGNELSNSVGMDVNSTVCPGIENWAQFSVISNNIIHDCAGSGIDAGGRYNVVIGNTVYNNSQFNPGTLSGIKARYGSASYNSDETIFSGNKSFNTDGVTGPQLYGYSEESSSLVNIRLLGNHFDLNRNGPIEILSPFTASGLIGRAPVIRTSNYSFLNENYNSQIFNGSGTITVTLPNVLNYPGRMLHIKTIAAQTVVSASSNVKPINTDVAGTAILPATAGGWATLQSDGTNWIIMARGT